MIPTRNRRALLSRTLATVLWQREVDLEVIVVDDCSTDGTVAMVLGLGDRRLSVVRQDERCGVSEARNRGIEQSTGEWVAFLDDDDLWAPDKLLKQLRCAQALSRGWAYGGSVMVTSDLAMVAGGEPPSADAACRLMPLINMVPAGASNVLVRRDLLDRAGRFDTGLRHLADWDMWIRLAQLGLPAVVVEPILAYVLHSGNASVDTGEAPDEMMVIEERYRHLRSPAAAGSRVGVSVDRVASPARWPTRQGVEGLRARRYATAM